MVMAHNQDFSLAKMSPLLLAADLDKSLTFFTSQLGFQVDFRYEDFYVGISREGCSIHLKKRWSREAEPQRDPDGHILAFVEENA